MVIKFIPFNVGDLYGILCATAFLSYGAGSMIVAKECHKDDEDENDGFATGRLDGVGMADVAVGTGILLGALARSLKLGK